MLFRGGVTLLIGLVCSCTGLEVLQQPVSAESATAEAGGVRVTARIWPEMDRQGVEPLAIDVVIENRSGAPIVVDYDSIALMSAADGSARVEPMKPPIPKRVRVVRRSGLTDAPVWPGPFSNETVRQLDEPRTPRDLPEWERRPLDEGVLPPGESLEGFVFFPALDESLLPLTLAFDVQNGIDGRRLGSVRLPLLADP